MSGSLLKKVNARLDLPSRKTVSGLIQGRGKSRFKGSGEDFDDLRTYQAGDKISDIDWKATARSAEPLIRQYNEERVRTVMIVADTSRDMAALAADGTNKRDALVSAAGLVCVAAQQNGDLVGLIAGDSERNLHLPARASDGHLELILRTLHREATLESHPPAALELLKRATRSIKRPSVVVYICDETHPGPAERDVLRSLTARHDVLVVRIQNADPLQAEYIEAEVVDTSHPMLLDLGVRLNKRLRREVAQARTQRDLEIKEALRRLDIMEISAAGDSEIIPAMTYRLRRRAKYALHA